MASIIMVIHYKDLIRLLLWLLILIHYHTYMLITGELRYDNTSYC